MKIPIVIIDLINQKIIETITSDFIFHQTYFELNFNFISEELNEHGVLERFHRHSHVLIKRQSLIGCSKTRLDESKAWRISIYDGSAEPCYVYFKKNKEASSFLELLRSYIFEDMECIT